MDDVTHLAGCDLGHPSRQRCSSWVPPVEPDAVSTTLLQAEQATRSRETPNSRWGWFWLTVAFTSIVWIPAALISSVILVVGIVWASDRAGWIDVGDPDYIRESKPDGATLVLREPCCGGSHDDSGVVQFFYASDLPFDQVAAEYTDSLNKQGFRSRADDDWLAGETGVRFSKKSDPQKCFTIVPFTRAYNLSYTASYSVDTDALRRELLASPHPYVGLFTRLCRG